jgi:hypothetical protein
MMHDPDKCGCMVWGGAAFSQKGGCIYQFPKNIIIIVNSCMGNSLSSLKRKMLDGAYSSRQQQSCSSGTGSQINIFDDD